MNATTFADLAAAIITPLIGALIVIRAWDLVKDLTK